MCVCALHVYITDEDSCIVVGPTCMSYDFWLL